MSHQIKIPPVGESITSALVATWHVADGATVSKGEKLMTMETDKVSNELEADCGGVLKILVPEGEEVAIGTVIAEIIEGEGGGDKDDHSEKSEQKDKLPPVPAEKIDSIDPVEIVVPPFGESITSATVAQWLVSEGSFVNRGDKLVSLETDKVSNELDAEVSGVVSLSIEEGSDVEIGTVLGQIIPKAEEAGSNVPFAEGATNQEVQEKTTQSEPEKPRESQPALEVVQPAEIDDHSRVSRQKMTPLRRKIADHLVNAQQTAAILTTFNEVDMSAIMKLRKDVQEDFVAKHGVKLGFMSLFVKSVVQALKDVPQINGRIEGDEIVQNHYYDIGVAVGTPKGLVVPVIRDCDQKSFAKIEQDIISYATRAKEGGLELADLQGGVFTISNGGVYGSLLSTPILNPPQSGILGMHTIQQRPVAVDGEVVIRPMMYLAMSYDHRLVDGKEAVTFLIKIKDCLENPTRLMLEV